MSALYPRFPLAAARLLLIYACLPAIVADAATHSAAWLSPGSGKGHNPVARPLDAMTLVSGQSPQLDSRVLIEPEAAVWSVTLKDGEEERGERQWATLGVTLPENARAASGVRLVLDSERPIVFGCELRTVRGKTGGFTGTRSLGRIQRILHSGPQEVTLLYADAGVKSGSEAVGSYIFQIDSVPARIAIREIELLFPTAEAANAFSREQAIALANDLATMRQWLAARGLALPDTDSGLSPQQQEARCWQAAQLLAIQEQLAFWSAFAESDAATADRLTTERDAIATALAAASATDLAGRICALQQETDSFIDGLRSTVPVDQRRWSVSDQKGFLDPHGLPFRVYAPFFFRAIYPPQMGDFRLWRPWDVRYLSALGFNGLRLPIEWHHLEPVQGQFEPAYLAMLHTIIEEAERYGLAVVIDLHWPYPEWFRRGEPGFEPATADISPNNSYHWPEALADSWGRLAAEFHPYPNVIAYEVPTNETPISSGPKGVLAYPSLMRSWNQWLKNTYGTRDALAATWGTGSGVLRDGEDWGSNTIAPLGFQGDADAAEAYASNPRLWDHLRWAAWVQADTTRQIMDRIEASAPGAVAVMQRTIGDVYDRSPVPLDYNSIQTVTDPRVWPGTHYGMGGLSARKARAFSLGSFDSEQQMENNFGQVRRHVELGLGFCPFSFHSRGGGGMLFRDDNWYLKPSVLYLPQQAEWIRTYWPQEPATTKTTVAVVQNSRLAATTRRGAINTAVALLEAQPDFNVKVYEALRVTREPKLLADADWIITDTDSMDPELLEILANQNSARILLFGGLRTDAWQRTGIHSPAADLARRGILFAPAVATGGLDRGADGSQSSPRALDLDGIWDWSFTGSAEGSPSLAAAARIPSTRWQAMQVPGTWGEKGILGTREFFVGDGWYRKIVRIPSGWKQNDLRLDIGGIDDLDWVYFNGKLIGHTGEDTPEYWMARRQYTIPAEAVNWKGDNALLICVRNLRDDGGIWKGPVRITGTEDWQLRIGNKPAIGSVMVNDSAIVEASQLHPSSRQEARLIQPNGNSIPALVSQGRWYWWALDFSATTEASANRMLVKWMAELRH